MAIRISETIYFVRDMDEAIRFYSEQLGFTLEQRYEWGFAVLSLAGTKFGLMLETLWDREYPDTDTLPVARIALQTDDFMGEVHRLKAMGVAFNTINGEPGQRQSATFFDADENPCFLWSDPEEPME